MSGSPEGTPVPFLREAGMCRLSLERAAVAAR